MSLDQAGNVVEERPPFVRVCLSLLVVVGVVVCFYRIDALEAWVQYVAQHYVAPLIGLEE